MNIVIVTQTTRRSETFSRLDYLLHRYYNQLPNSQIPSMFVMLCVTLACTHLLTFIIVSGILMNFLDSLLRDSFGPPYIGCREYLSFVRIPHLVPKCRVIIKIKRNKFSSRQILSSRLSSTLYNNTWVWRTTWWWFEFRNSNFLF
jgi:hypothetical protein